MGSAQNDLSMTAASESIASKRVASQDHPVLILGAGINGCALARELAINGVPVCLVDATDIASGTSVYSTRLIHGGLRYLEYGEFDLVRESLEERTRLLHLAPQFVRPIELFIPTESRFNGLTSAMTRMLGFGGAGSREGRGAWLVRCGLWLYDRYARDPSLPKHQTHRVGQGDVPPVDPHRYRFLSSYFDAQIVCVERFVLALLDDAQAAAAASGTRFEVFNYHRAARQGRVVSLHPTLPVQATNTDVASVSENDIDGGVSFEPAVIVNATGAWVDWTLAELNIDSPDLIAGTKGSHFITSSPRLLEQLSKHGQLCKHDKPGTHEQLGQHGIFAESGDDGRPIFILPFDGRVLVGTTDLPYSGRPEEAVANEDELAYLIRGVNRVFPAVELSRDDIEMHYSGVRPLPRTDAKTTASVTRRHWMQEHVGAEVPTYSIIGGKLTTCRSLAESAADTIMTRLGVHRVAGSRDRVIPGGEDYPSDAVALADRQRSIAEASGFSSAQVEAVWQLCGTTTREWLCPAAESNTDDSTINDEGSVAGTDIPRAFVRRLIAEQWVRQLDDLVERRLMLMFDPLSLATLEDLAALLVESGRLRPDQVAEHVTATVQRLRTHFGKTVSAASGG